MSNENQITETFLEAIEARKSSVQAIIETAWNETKRPEHSAAYHLVKFHQTVLESLKDPEFAFTFTLGIISQVLSDILTPEEREELRKESTHIGGLNG